MTDSFLICRSCGTLSPLDGAEHGLSADEVAERLLDDHRFREQHSTHGIEHAARHTTPVLYDGPAWDPMAGQWFEITAGSDLFLVHSSRLSIEEPRHCRVVSGAIKVGSPVLEIDEPYLRLALDRCFFPHVLAPATLDRFINLVHTLIRALPADAVETSFDDADDPDVSIGPCPPNLATALCREAASLFDDGQMERVIAFVSANRREDGALALRVRRRVALRP